MTIKIPKRLKIKQLSSERAKQLGLYMVFVVISSVFWLFVSLNNTLQKDIKVAITLVNVPDSITIIGPLQTDVTVGVRDRGVALVKFLVGQEPELKINYKDYSNGEGKVIVQSSEFKRLVRKIFENSTTITGYSIDHLDIKYTDLPGKMVPVRMDLDLHANMQYVIYGSIELSEDSVRVFSDRNTLASIDEVYTYHVEEKELQDTVLRTVSIAPIPGTRIEPDKVTIKIPVEPLITKSVDIPVRVKNVPKEVSVMTFPSLVRASFLVPFSMYRSQCHMEAVANYDNVANSTDNKLCIRIEEAPAMYQNVSLGQDSVEYIIEKKR